MATPGKDTKTKILRQAEDLFRERSYSGFSYQDISKPLGVRNAAIHYHFPSKGDLGVAIIERYRRLLSRLTRDQAETGTQALVQLENLFSFELAQASNRGRKLVCPIAVLATDYYHVSEEMRHAGKQLVTELLAWLTDVLTIGRRDGVMSFDGVPEHKASSILAAFLGARQLARVGGYNALKNAVEQVRRDLNLSD